MHHTLSTETPGNKKKEPRGCGSLVLGMAMRFCRMRAVRPCCAVHPSTEAFGRPAREAFSKSLPQEEPTVSCATTIHSWHISHGALQAALASPSQLCELSSFRPVPALRRGDRLKFRCQVKSRGRVLRAEARLAPRVIRSLNLATTALRYFSGVLRMANRSEAAFSPKRHS